METPAPRRPARTWLTLCAVAAVAGAATGALGAGFRWCLTTADRLRLDLVAWAHTLPGPGWLLVVAAAALGAALAALVVRLVPLAAGSGIPHVEAVDRGDADPPLLVLLPAKFVGGVLAIGSGLVLGREGPTVHMGAALGADAARRAHLDAADVRTMQTAVGGAGLAAAFNAPLGGVLFALEEVTRSFRLEAVLAALVAATTAVGVLRVLLGNEADFAVVPVETPPLQWLPLFAVFGLLTGLLGAVYNRLVLAATDRVAAVRRVPPVAKAALIGALVGLAMVVQPLGVGGGDTLTALILGGQALALPAVVGYLLIRLLAGPLSYAAAVPGGLFAPLLAVGALWGVFVTGVLGALTPLDVAPMVVPMALVGMAALFGATVRAPVTGIVVVIEMTATVAVAVPMLLATALAVLVAEVTDTPPIYESLRARMVLPPRDAPPVL